MPVRFTSVGKDGKTEIFNLNKEGMLAIAGSISFVAFIDICKQSR